MKTSGLQPRGARIELAPSERATPYVAWALGVSLVLMPVLSCFHFANHHVDVRFEGSWERVSYYVTYLAAVLAGYGVYLDTRVKNQGPRNVYTGSVFLLMVAIVAHAFGAAPPEHFPILPAWSMAYFFITSCSVLAVIRTQRWRYWLSWWIVAQLYALLLFAWGGVLLS